MTTKELLEETTPNAIEQADDDRLNLLYNYITGGLAGAQEGEARQLVERLSAIHAEKAARQAKKIAEDAKQPKKIERSILKATIVGACFAGLGFAAVVYQILCG